MFRLVLQQREEAFKRLEHTRDSAERQHRDELSRVFTSEQLKWELDHRDAEQLRAVTQKIANLDTSSERQRSLNLEIDRARRALDELSDQLTKFYWPLYFHLLEDDAVWRARFRADAALAAQLDQVRLLPNHLAALALIESNVQLVTPDSALRDKLEHYLRHVALYEALRATGRKKNPKDYGVPFDDSFAPFVRSRIDSLEQRYQQLIGSTKLVDAKP